MPTSKFNWFYQRDIVIHYVTFFFCKHRIETYAPNPVSDNTEGESVMFLQAQGVTRFKNYYKSQMKPKLLFLLDKTFAF